MLGKLNIRCKYEENGCQHISSLDNLNIHEISCIFKEKICVKCFCKLLENHDCTQSLLEAVHELNENMNTLVTQLKSQSNPTLPIPIENDSQIISTLPTNTRTECCNDSTKKV